MTPDTAILKAVEALRYRVTVGDVAAKAGLEVELTRSGLLALASEVGGHLQVSDTGEIVYLFPKDFRAILRNKYLGLKIKAWLAPIGKFLFYLFRISFGIFLMISIVIMMIAITIILSFLSSQDNDRGGDGVNINFNWFPDFWLIFNPGYGGDYYQRHRYTEEKSMNFLEAVYSFLFGDGNPNGELEEQRWQTIGAVIRNYGGAIASEQIAPYLDEVAPDNEDYILPVLTRFNGYPEVSPTGEIIYYFPDLQVSAQAQESLELAPYLQEKRWKFSEANEGQIWGAIGLGSLNLTLAIALGFLLFNFGADITTYVGNFLTWVHSVYAILLAYAAAFLGIPFFRYFGVQRRNQGVEKRNSSRQSRAASLHVDNEVLTRKLKYAREFAKSQVITEAEISYTTEKDLLEQEADNSEKIDQEWQRRLEGS